jgi:hypothetical protein
MGPRHIVVHEIHPRWPESTVPIAFRLTRFLLVTAAANLVVACAEPKFAGTAADPSVRVPVVPYDSVFATYRMPSDDEGPASWREINDEVGRLRGHQDHLADPSEGALEKDDSGLVKDPPPDRAVERDSPRAAPPAKAN